MCVDWTLRALADLNHQPSFIKLHLGAAGPEPADAEALRMELADLQQKCNLLMEENKELRNRVRERKISFFKCTDNQSCLCLSVLLLL